jgi:ligand-binding sensor domain-containing protein
LAGTNSGLYKCDSNNKEKIEFPAALPINSITSIHCYEDKWFLGTENGLFVNDNGSWSQIDIRPLNTYVTAISHDFNKTVWIGTNNGLCMYYDNKVTILK